MSVPKDFPIFLEGERIYLCPVRREHALQYSIWLNDRETSNLLMMHRVLSLEDENEIMDGILKSKPETLVPVGIWLKEPLIFIGGCSLFEIDSRNQHCHIGIFIGDKNYWSKGFGSEAMRLLIDYAFKTLNMRKVCLTVFSHNPRAERCYDKIGFKEIGRRYEHRYIDGQWRDEILMELFRDDFYI